MGRSLRVSPDGAELRVLAARVAARAGSRRIIGIAGAPGAGKSRLAAMLAEELAEELGVRVAVVPLDGFHLADVELERRGLLGRKGAPETFDAWGYAALLDRLSGRPDHRVYAPGFERLLEQPLAGAVSVDPDAAVVLTEGNYLLLDRPEWKAGRERLDEMWFVEVEPALRRERLRARHVAFGKTPEAAAEWVDRVDEPNARLVGDHRDGAELLLDLTAWTGSVGPG